MLRNEAVIAYMAEVAGSTAIPESSFAVFAPAAFLGLALAGLAIALAGAYLPAQRAARAADRPGPPGGVVFFRPSVSR